MLYLIGTGLNDEFDLSLKAIEILKKCDEVYFEFYTSLSRINIFNLEKLINKKIIKVNRSFVEERAEELIKKAQNKDLALLIIGHPLIATTHSIFLENANVKIIHNYSIINAISITGLELYKFGRIVSIPFHESKSYIEYIKKNLSANLHTLILLDLKTEENKFMNINEALIKLSDFKEHKFVACCALATEDEKIYYGSYEKLLNIDFEKKPKPQCLILPSSLHFVEEELLSRYIIN
ncbi:MAG: diphthine synthase [Candidatus Woesearchaeota archaeon]